MGLLMKWSCDRCGKHKFVRVKYDWADGLGDVWHPSWLNGFGEKGGVFCGPCFRVVSDEWRKKNSDVVVTA